MKKCYGYCKEMKPLDDFCNHKSGKYGKSDVCKDCMKQSRKNRKNKVAAYNKEYNKKNAKKLVEHQRMLNQENPEKWKARSRVNHAIKLGNMVRPEKCDDCGNECKPDGHHDCYKEENWFKVRWLCKPCHKIADEQMRTASHYNK